MKKTIKYFSALLVGSTLLFFSCQKEERPPLADYPKDVNAPGGPLKFFAAFDGTSTNVLLNAVDSIRANFPATNPMTSIDGISGKAIQGDAANFLTYPSPNDFGSTASSFTISFWEKQDGTPAGNAAFLFTIPSGNKWWGSYGFSMFLLFDQSTPADSAILKLYMVDDKDPANISDAWLTWEGHNKVYKVQDNTWHHLVFVYDATTSNLTLYVDGVANSHVPQWTGHGGLKIDNSNVQALNIGGNKSAPGDLGGWGQQWPGGIDQFRLYSTALSATDVQALYTGKK